jgi:hypothetical protein
MFLDNFDQFSGDFLKKHFLNIPHKTLAGLKANITCSK